MRLPRACRGAVGRNPDQTIIGAGPDRSLADRRRRERVDDAAMRALLRIVALERSQNRRHARVRTREIGADLPPALTTVLRSEDEVRSEVEPAFVEGIEGERFGAHHAAIFRTKDDRRDLLRLPGALVELSNLSAEEDTGMQRIGYDVTVLLGARGMPVALRRLAPIAAAAHAGRAALLLAAADPIRKATVGIHVVHLRGGLVVPRAPRRTAVDRDRRTLIACEPNDLWIARIDPDRMIIVAAGGPLDRDERLAAIGRAVRRRVRQVDDLRIARVDRQRDKIVAPLRDFVGVVDACEVRARVVAAVECARIAAFRLDVSVRVYDVGVAGRDRDFGAPNLSRQSCRQLRPSRPAVARLVDPAPLHFEGCANLPRRLPGGPERCVDDL